MSITPPEDPDHLNALSQNPIADALVLEAERRSARYVVVVSTFAFDDVIGPEGAAAHLLGYMHRCDDFAITVNDSVEKSTHQITPT